MKIIEVVWIDSHYMPGWRDDKEIKEWNPDKWLCHSVGFLVNKDKNWLTICLNYVDFGNKGHVEKIPVVAIKKITILRK